MTQAPKIALQVFGAVLFLVILGMFIWSLFRPPVTDGPMPDPWKGAAADAATDG